MFESMGDGLGGVWWPLTPHVSCKHVSLRARGATVNAKENAARASCHYSRPAVQIPQLNLSLILFLVTLLIPHSSICVAYWENLWLHKQRRRRHARDKCLNLGYGGCLREAQTVTGMCEKPRAPERLPGTNASRSSRPPHRRQHAKQAGDGAAVAVIMLLKLRPWRLKSVLGLCCAVPIYLTSVARHYPRV